MALARPIKLHKAIAAQHGAVEGHFTGDGAPANMPGSARPEKRAFAHNLRAAERDDASLRTRARPCAGRPRPAPFSRIGAVPGTKVGTVGHGRQSPPHAARRAHPRHAAGTGGRSRSSSQGRVETARAAERRGSPLCHGKGPERGSIRPSSGRAVRRRHREPAHRTARREAAASLQATTRPSTVIGTPSSESEQPRSGMSRWQGVSRLPPASVLGPVENRKLPAKQRLSMLSAASRS